MNPIFSRRYKGGSRPNIMPTSKRHNALKSLSTLSSGSSSSSTGTSALSTLSLGDSLDEPSLSDNEPSKSPILEHSPFAPQKSGSGRKGASSPGEEVTSRNASRLLAQQLLASKQNMLAQVSLTPHENRQRTKLGSQPKLDEPLGFTMRHSFSTDNFGESSTVNNLPRSPTVHDIGGDMTICDLDFDDDQTDFNKGSSSTTTSVTPSYGYSLTSSSPLNNSRVARPNLNQRISKDPLDMKTWRELKRIVTGTGGFQEGWIGQGFVFDTKIPFGLLQKKGGPCGVLAVVQSLLIRNLLFDSPLFAEVKKDLEWNLGEIEGYLVKGGKGDDGFTEKIRKERVRCLVDAVAEVIWVCAVQRQKDEGRSSSEKDCVSIIMLMSDYRIQPETIRVSGKLELQHFLQNSIHRFDCIALVYSAVLTRGITGVKNDMDFENCSLIGQHGYCSQELINLFCLGKAISNTFDNEIELDGKVLKGIPAQCDIGLLSLFEHYDSIKVGNNLKCPRYPVWIVCSESHFSVLFSCDLSLCKESEVCGYSKHPNFDLFYYDGLSRQEKIIRLSVCTSNPSSDPARSGKQQWGRSNAMSAINHRAGPSTSSAFGDEELIPPLEKCIRTKWKGASVDWNDTEPIL